MNVVGLFIAGRKLEHLVGPAWFGAIYVVSALCGAFASLALNAPTLITVGASGAIMGLFAAMLDPQLSVSAWSRSAPICSRTPSTFSFPHSCR